MAKLSKASVDYSRGHPDAHCGICRHYIRPAECEIVAGTISPMMWCERFEKRKGMDMAKSRKKPGKRGGY